MPQKSAGLKKVPPKRPARPGRVAPPGPAERTIRSIFRHASIAFLTYNREGELLLWNRALESLLGLPGGALKGKRLFEIAAKGNERPRTGGIIEAVFGGKGVAGIQWEIQTGGESRYLSISTFPMRTGAGPISFGIAVLTDVTEKKRLEQALRRAEKMAALGTLASGLAHEVGTPMNVILGRAESLLRHTKEEKTAEGLKIIIDQVDRMTRLIQQLLAFARRKPLEKKWVQINDIAGKAIEIVGPQIAAKALSVVADLAAPLPPLRGNGDQLLQLFMNLFMNAIDASRPKGKIKIATRAIRIERREEPRAGVSPDGNRMVEILFSDTGTGIDPCHLDHLFDPFFTTKPVGKGTGLGLAVVHGIIQDHGGEINVESTLGKGTTFQIRLPLG
ncbi:MAG TPA: ATP-binding protein [Candidatus Manganitrophaceae bacterium]|nr:ATP-binding protein [Candidatus Manganitrophaceae bacterium]